MESKKYKPINHKSAIEYSKQIWSLKRGDEEIDRFRQRVNALNEKKRLEKIYLEELTVERIHLL